MPLEKMCNNLKIPSQTIGQVQVLPCYYTLVSTTLTKSHKTELSLSEILRHHKTCGFFIVTQVRSYVQCDSKATIKYRVSVPFYGGITGNNVSNIINLPTYPAMKENMQSNNQAIPVRPNVWMDKNTARPIHPHVLTGICDCKQQQQQNY